MYITAIYLATWGLTISLGAWELMLVELSLVTSDWVCKVIALMIN